MVRAPLPLLPGYWTRPEDRQRVVNAMFNRSARHYERACAIMSFGSGAAYRRAALVRAGLRTDLDVLDVGTGTGLLAREAARLVGSSGRVIGIDPSIQMMVTGRDRGTTGLVQGLGESLPFSDGQFDYVTMGYALRHVGDLDQLFAEYARVLKPGGRLLLLEITKPASTLGSMLMQAYFGTVVPYLTRIGTRSTHSSQLMKFYWETIAYCVAPEVILASIRRAGFVAERTVIAGIFSEYLGTRGNSQLSAVADG
ncbi:MAG TPA: class I SAM-dependent methyltransferase [Vicinamibacterales bacterium]|nr:class I SAM-dependent methyltransferase [Vicinamibacterales bacterium]